MIKKQTGILFIVVGLALIFWGYNIAGSFSGQFSSAFTGSPGDKAMALYIIGGILAAVGLFRTVK